MTGASSRLLALAGTAVLAAVIARPFAPGSLVAAAPLAVILAAGLLRLRYWAICTAIAMLPYFSWGVMELLTNPAGRAGAIAFAALTIAVFLAALDALRRQ